MICHQIAGDLTSVFLIPVINDRADKVGTIFKMMVEAALGHPKLCSDRTNTQRRVTR
jgi:hypothetical protein